MLIPRYCHYNQTIRFSFREFPLYNVHLSKKFAKNLHLTVRIHNFPNPNPYPNPISTLQLPQQISSHSYPPYFTLQFFAEMARFIKVNLYGSIKVSCSIPYYSIYEQFLCNTKLTTAVHWRSHLSNFPYWSELTQTYWMTVPTVWNIIHVTFYKKLRIWVSIGTFVKLSHFLDSAFLTNFFINMSQRSSCSLPAPPPLLWTFANTVFWSIYNFQAPVIFLWY